MRDAVVVETRTNKNKYSVGEEVELSVAVNNTGSSPVELIFTSAQRCDFIVLKDDNEVWHWSSGKMFAMIIEQLILKPNEAQTYTKIWKPSGVTPRKYEVMGIIMSRPPLRATCTFNLSNK